MNDIPASDQPSQIYVDRPIRQILLSTADLKKLSNNERGLLLTLGHASNEMAALYRATCSAGKEARVDADPVTRQVGRAQALLMLRLALSKMHELIEKTTEGRYQEILAKADAEYASAVQEARDGVGKYMPLRDLRNCFGFHYKSSVIGGLGTHRLGKEKEETHDFIVADKSVNTFFSLSEFFYQKAFASTWVNKLSFEDFARTGILTFIEDGLIVMDKFIRAVQQAVFKLYYANGIDLSEPTRCQETVALFVPIDEARLPAFIAFNSKKAT